MTGIRNFTSSFLRHTSWKDMPKKSRKVETASKIPNKTTPVQEPVYCDPVSGVTIVQIHAKPGAKISAITGISEEGICVQIAAAPVDGEANVELIRFLATVLNVRKGSLSLEKGNRNRSKLVAINVDGFSPDVVLGKLKQEIQEK